MLGKLISVCSMLSKSRIFQGLCPLDPTEGLKFPQTPSYKCLRYRTQLNFGLDPCLIPLKQLCLEPPMNLVIFVFIYQTHCARILAKSIHQGEGGCCSCFLNEMYKKIEHMNFFALLQNPANAEGWGGGSINLYQARCFKA